MELPLPFYLQHYSLTQIALLSAARGDELNAFVWLTHAYDEITGSLMNHVGIYRRPMKRQYFGTEC